MQLSSELKLREHREQQLKQTVDTERKRSEAQCNRYATEVKELQRALHHATMTNMTLKNNAKPRAAPSKTTKNQRTLEAVKNHNQQLAAVNQQLLQKLSEQKTRKCRNPDFDVGREQNLQVWAARVEKFLIQSQVGAPQREAVYIHLCSQSRVVLTQAEFSAAQSPAQAQADELRHEGAVQFVNLLAEHWKISKFVNLRIEKGISLRKQLSVRNHLVCQRDSETGRYKLLSFEIGGKQVKMADFASKYLQKKWVREHTEEFDIADLPRCRGASADFVAIACKLAKQMLEAGILTMTESGELMTNDGRKVIIIWSLDGSLGFKGQKLVNFTFRMLPGIGPTHSVNNVQLFLVYEGGDTNRAILHNCQQVLPKLNKFIAEEQIEVEKCKCAIGHRFCADIPALQANYGLCGGKCEHTCPWCECPRSDHFKKHVKYPRRTIEDIRLYAHRAIGKCPGCGLQIVSEEDWKEKVRAKETAGFCKIAASGDDVPSHLLKTVKQLFPDHSFLQVHKGVTYGSDIAVELPLRYAHACIMHMNGCLVGMLFKGSVLTTLTSYHSKSGSDKESLCMQLVVFLNSLGFNVNKLQPADSNVGTWYHSLSKHSPAGRDTSILLEVFEKVLGTYVFPEDLRKSDVDARDKYERWIQVWTFYRDSIWRPLCDFTISKCDKAALIKKNAGEFIDLYCAASVVTGHLYPHVLYEHIDEMIMDSDVDLWESQLQANEHMNKWVKTRQRDTTSKQKQSQIVDVSAQQRVVYTADNVATIKTVAGHKRKTGDSRTKQLVTMAAARLSLDIFATDLTQEQAKKVQTAKKAAEKALLDKKLGTVSSL